jgi:hypothetical protein
LPTDRKTLEALRKLIRTPPQAEIKRAILNAMESRDHDRGVALAMVSLVDALLVGAIAYVGPMSQNNIIDIWSGKKLTWYQGEIRTFGDRIEEAFKLKIIGQKTRGNLQLLREIRNVFAHALSDVTFLHPVIDRACCDIELSTMGKFFVDHELNRKARYRYGYACHEVYSALLNYLGSNMLFVQPRRSPDAPVVL